MPPPVPAPAESRRVASVDALRGLVMVAMALDHTRDYFHSSAILFDPEDLAVLLALLSYGHAGFLFGSPPNTDTYPQGYGYPLGAVYLVWIVVVALSYPLCRWFAGVKRRRRDWWLAYV